MRPVKIKCVECNRTKGASNFSYRKTICNKCYKEGPSYAKQRDRYLRTTYGLSIAEYNQLLEAQGGGCAVCGGGSAGKNLAVDHNHKTGEVRALLCKRHNSAMARWVRTAVEAKRIARVFEHGAADVARVLGRRVVVPGEDD
jgi:hypothetical protein